MKLILASQSPRRSELLKQIGIIPDEIIPSDIDETPLKKELPREYVVRIACEKCAHIARQHQNDVVLAADTIVVAGRRILMKPNDIAEAKKFMQLLSGRRHKVFTAIAAMKNGEIKTRLAITVVKFKRLMEQEIDKFLMQNEWQGKSGGYTIQGHAAKFIEFIRGDEQSNVVGLPLNYTYNLLTSFGLTI